MKKFNEDIEWMKQQNETLQLAIKDMIVFGTGIIKINLDFSIEYVDYFTWLNMSKEEKSECTQIRV